MSEADTGYMGTIAWYGHGTPETHAYRLDAVSRADTDGVDFNRMARKPKPFSVLITIFADTLNELRNRVDAWQYRQGQGHYPLTLAQGVLADVLLQDVQKLDSPQQLLNATNGAAWRQRLRLTCIQIKEY